MLDTGAIWLFVGCKLAEKLPATVQTMKPPTAILPMGKTLVSTTAINLDMLIDEFHPYIILLHINSSKSINSG